MSTKKTEKACTARTVKTATQPKKNREVLRSEARMGKLEAVKKSIDVYNNTLCAKHGEQPMIDTLLERVAFHASLAMSEILRAQLAWEKVRVFTKSGADLNNRNVKDLLEFIFGKKTLEAHTVTAKADTGCVCGCGKKCDKKCDKKCCKSTKKPVKAVKPDTVAEVPAKPAEAK